MLRLNKRMGRTLTVMYLKDTFQGVKIGIRMLTVLVRILKALNRLLQKKKKKKKKKNPDMRTEFVCAETGSLNFASCYCFLGHFSG